MQFPGKLSLNPTKTRRGFFYFLPFRAERLHRAVFELEHQRSCFCRSKHLYHQGLHIPNTNDDRAGSFHELYERSIYEQTFMSEPIENHAVSNKLSNVNLKKYIRKHSRVRNREPNRTSVQTLHRLRNKSKKVREFVYERIRSSTPKSLHCYIKVGKQQS